MVSVFTPNGYYLRNRRKQSILYSLSEVLCLFVLFLQLSACSWWFSVFRYVACGFSGLQSCRQNCRKLSQTDAKLLQNSLKIHPKSTKMVPRSDLSVRAARDGQNDERLNVQKSTFWQTLAILGHFWDPSKSSQGPKTAKKIEYGDFLVPLDVQKA